MATEVTQTQQLTSADLIAIVWGSIQMYSVKLRELLTQYAAPSVPSQHKKSLKQPTMNTKIPSLVTRRAACTHLTMERLYGDFQCNICHQPSRLGWVYLCTQDDKQLPTLDAVKELFDDLVPRDDNQQGMSSEPKRPAYDLPSNAIPDDDLPKFQMPTAELAPWIKKAINDGHYTAEQVEIVRSQKQSVADTAKAVIESYEREQMAKDAEQLRMGPRPSSTEASDSNQGAEPKLVKLKMFPYCKFRSCQACRPNHRDRTWQAINDAYAKDATMVVKCEATNIYAVRPVSSAELMQNIGLRPSPSGTLGPARGTRPSLRTLVERQRWLNEVNQVNGRLTITQLPGQAQFVSLVDPAEPESEDVADVEVEPGAGTRGSDTTLEAGTRSFRNCIREDLRSLTRRRSSTRSSKRRKLESESKTSFDLSQRENLNDRLLQEAASVPLPEQDVVDESVAQVGEKEVVEVAEGISVKVESVEVGAADIIASV